MDQNNNTQFNEVVTEAWLSTIMKGSTKHRRGTRNFNKPCDEVSRSDPKPRRHPPTPHSHDSKRGQAQGWVDAPDICIKKSRPLAHPVEGP